MQIPENVGPTINLTLFLNPKDVSIGDSGNIPINKQMAASVGIKYSKFLILNNWPNMRVLMYKKADKRIKTNISQIGRKKVSIFDKKLPIEI